MKGISPPACRCEEQEQLGGMGYACKCILSLEAIQNLTTAQLASEVSKHLRVRQPYDRAGVCKLCGAISW